MNITRTSAIGWPLVIVLSLIPLFIWLFSRASVALHFTSGGAFNYALTMQAFGQALGLVGVVLFAINLVLGARLRFLEDIFGGMNKVYIAHHILGGIAFMLLLLHPLFLIAQNLAWGVIGLKQAFILYVANPQCYAAFGLMNQECSYLFGVIALALMIVFLVLTFFVKLRYDIWKYTHKFLGLAFFFAALHSLFISSDVTSVVILKYYVWVFVVLGFAAILYRTVLGAFLVRTREYIVDEVKQVNPSIVEIVLKSKEGKPMEYVAGQFIFIGFPDHKDLEEVHPFSLSSSPSNDKLSIGVKGLGDYTKRLNELVQGDRAVVEGPFGRTSYKYYANKEQIWIAGGIGVTPFLGMARNLTPESGYKVDMYYSAVSLEEAAFDAEFQSIAAANPNFRFIPWYGKEKGFLSADAIAKESKNLLGKEIFVCGPPPMMRSIKAQLATWKVPTTNVHSEEFSMN
jgi:predicted ferric reductase